MEVAISLVSPLLGTIVLGYLLSRARYISDGGIDGINRYVVSIALPSLLVRALATTELPNEWPWGLWLSYFLPAIAVWGLGFTIACIVMKRPRGEGIIVGFGSALSNSALLGIPMILTAFGDQAGPPLFLLLALDGLVLLSLATFLLETESDADGTRGRAGAVWAGFRGTVRSPIILGLAAGIVMAAIDVRIPEPIDRLLGMLANSAIPCALFVLGATLNRHQLGRDLPSSVITMVLKLLIHPLLVWILATFVFGLPPLWTIVATLAAAMPTGVFSAILAARYRTGSGAASGAVLLTTVVSLVTVTVLIAVLLP